MSTENLIHHGKVMHIEIGEGPMASVKVWTERDGIEGYETFTVCSRHPPPMGVEIVFATNAIGVMTSWFEAANRLDSAEVTQ